MESRALHRARSPKNIRPLPHEAKSWGRRYLETAKNFERLGKGRPDPKVRTIGSWFGAYREASNGVFRHDLIEAG